ncbi:MAG: hypothetical protein WCV59_04165 [Parcubacteria group bacterium]|jgi:hypothetical protein
MNQPKKVTEKSLTGNKGNLLKFPVPIDEREPVKPPSSHEIKRAFSELFMAKAVQTT